MHFRLATVFRSVAAAAALVMALLTMNEIWWFDLRVRGRWQFVEGIVCFSPTMNSAPGLWLVKVPVQIHTVKDCLKILPSKFSEHSVMSALLPKGRFPNDFWDSADRIDWAFVRRMSRE